MKNDMFIQGALVKSIKKGAYIKKPINLQIYKIVRKYFWADVVSYRKKKV